jgi:S-adenosylmethionine decarboxylase
MTGSPMNGIEWIVEAHGCTPERLNDLQVTRELFGRIISELDLRVIGKAQWHQFPTTGGITGLALLTESHLAIHTFPEFGSVCLNLFCCVPRKEWDFAASCGQLFGAESVTVRRLPRDYVLQDRALAVTAVRAHE